jgi:hypothetical protein
MIAHGACLGNDKDITTKRLAMKGLIVSDWLDRQPEFRHGGRCYAGRRSGAASSRGV